MSEREPSRPGSILRAEREALGVTVREVSETLNLSMAMIEAIEADDLERLPGPVFARGYVRAYARLLELDPEPLVSTYPPPEVTLAAARQAESPVWEWIRQRPAIVLGGAAGALLLLIVVLLAWLWPSGAPPAPADRTTMGSAAGPTAFGSAGAGADGAAEDASFDAALDAADGADALGRVEEDYRATAAAALPGAAPPEQEDHLAWPQAMAAAPAAPDEQGAVIRRITESGQERLAFTFTEDCWVEVRDSNDRNLYSELSRRGNRLVLVGQGPFRILLGYAPGVELAYNGEALPLAPHTRNNVATLVLGQ